jgi:hypothetical protein
LIRTRASASIIANASEATSGTHDSNQYVFAHSCTLEAMRTQEAIFFVSNDDVNDSFD